MSRFREKLLGSQQPIPRYKDRLQAGKQLAKKIASAIAELGLAGVKAQPIVYALPRGGIPVAVPIARQLGCPLDVIIAKKITLPTNQEFAIGAVTADGYLIWHLARKQRAKISQQLNQALQKAQQKAQAQQDLFACVSSQISAKGKIAIIVDDGIATGMTMEAAVQSLQPDQPEQIWICVPVAPPEVLQLWKQRIEDSTLGANRLLILSTPSPFFSVSRFYLKFPQLDDKKALGMLQEYIRLLAEVE